MLRKRKPKNARRLGPAKHEAPGSNPGPSTLPGIVVAANSLLFKDRSEPVMQDAAKFVLLLALFTLVFYAAFGLLGVHYYFSLAAGYASVPILSALGVNSTLVSAGAGGAYPSIVGTANGAPFSAELGQLCGGGLELAILCGSVLASRDRSLRDRAKGVALGFLVVAVFNPLRISFTLTTAGTPALPLVHDLLFRGLLLVVLVGAYALWYLNTPSAVFLQTSPVRNH